MRPLTVTLATVSRPSHTNNILVPFGGGEGIYDHEHKVFKECKALKEAVTSLSTYDNLLYNPVLKKLKI